MGHTSTLALVGLSILLVLTALSSLKWPALGSPTVMIAFLIAYPVLFFTVSGGHVETPTDIFPLFGVACATVGNFLKNSLNIKIAFMSAGLLWLVYESSVGAYGQMVGEILTLAGNTMSITLIILAARRGIASSEVPELNERISSWIRSHKRPTQVEAS